MHTVFFSLLFSLLLALPVTATQLEVVAESPYQWTGLALSREQRMFVCYPTWRNYPRFKVAELVRGKAVAYPDAVTAAAFSCVQSVYADARDYLWVLDTGKPRGQQPRSGSAKLYKFDLRTNKLAWQYAFPPAVDLAASYLNDVRVDTRRHYAYLTDSGAGGIVVVKLPEEKSNSARQQTWEKARRSSAAGQPSSWRALTDIPQVLAQQEGINFSSTGYDKHQTHSDGLALTGVGRTLYFAPMTGQTLYSIATAKLRDRGLSVTQRARAIKVVSAKSVPTDGLWLQEQKIYMGDLAREGLFVYDLRQKQGTPLPVPVPVRWADSFAAAPQGDLYFTTSQINYRNQPPEPYRIYKLKR